MLEMRRVRTDSPEALALLDEYFGERAAGRPADAGPYVRKDPDPSRFVPPEGVFVVAVEEGVPIACGGVRVEPAVEDHELGGSRWLEVKHLFVRPDARGRGLSRALMLALEDAARELGADRLVLDTHTSQEAASGLYRALGYEEVAPYNDNGNANLWFARRLEA
ncbi:hypothetical protein USB125703_01627 [Pseudoclavibacter triregionum]|nr:hypothetical protein USB125703_01627 [Pseudoclavibacter triregionum]